MADTPIPPIGTTGLYSVKDPFTVDLTTIYTCSAIRQFVDLENLGTAVYETYYQPFEIPKATYEQDRRNGVVILTLTSAKAAPIYLPSSYLLRWPDLTSINYQYIVISVALGALPDSMDLTFAKQQITNVVSDVVGVTNAEVFVNAAPSSDVVTPEQHELAEANRQAAINNRTTDYAKRLELENTISRQQQRINILETIVKQNGLIPE